MSIYRDVCERSFQRRVLCVSPGLVRSIGMDQLGLREVSMTEKPLLLLPDWWNANISKLPRRGVARAIRTRESRVQEVSVD